MDALGTPARARDLPGAGASAAEPAPVPGLLASVAACSAAPDSQVLRAQEREAWAFGHKLHACIYLGSPPCTCLIGKEVSTSVLSQWRLLERQCCHSLSSRLPLLEQYPVYLVGSQFWSLMEVFLLHLFQPKIKFSLKHCAGSFDVRP